MSQDRRSSHSHRRPSPTRRHPERRTTEREMVQSDELSSTSGARLISSDNPYDPSMNPHASSSFPAIPSAGAPHPKSPAARAHQQLEASRTGGLPRITVDSSLPPSHTGRHARIEGTPRPSQTGRTPRVAAHANLQPDQTGQHAPVMDLHTEILNDSDSTDTRIPTIDPLDTAAPSADPDSVVTDERRTVRPPVSAKEGGRTDWSSFLPVDAEAQHSRFRRRGISRLVGVAVAVLAIIVVIFGINQAIYASPVEATVNGEKMTLEGNQRSIAGLLDENVVSVTPGNYVAVDNSVIREGDGARCTALINEQEVSLDGHINEGDFVVISNGNDIMEEFVDSEPTILPAGYTREDGWGALHVFLPGQDGELVMRTGSESGITIEQITKEKIDERLVYYNAETNGEKVVALTFDDGPWDTTTEQILDVLKENGVKATFYTIGNQVSQHSDQIKRMAEEGHEIATHSWDHAAGSGKGVSLDLMSTAERQQEVEKGLTVIEEISGKDASIYFRAPGGNFGDSTATDLMSLIDGEIGWNIDTEDWRRPGADVIAQRIMSVKPGNIVLMHDGGGDRSETVAGLREALSYLKDQGYKFVTISELIEQYPYQTSSN